MTALQNAATLLPQMSSVEKAQLLQWVISDLTNVFPGIVKTPGVCGGDACMANTRIPVWSIINSLQIGLTEKEILYNFPSLTHRDLKNALDYYRANESEIDEQISENHEDE